MVAGPDTTAFISNQECTVAKGILFRPGVLPRLLRIPAVEVRNNRVSLELLFPNIIGGSLLSLTTRLLEGETAQETAPWRLASCAMSPNNSEAQPPCTRSPTKSVGQQGI
jgi:hypothetical protein